MFGLENLLDEKHMYISSSDNGHISFLGFQLRIYMPILHNLSVKKKICGLIFEYFPTAQLELETQMQEDFSQLPPYINFTDNTKNISVYIQYSIHANNYLECNIFFSQGKYRQ